MDLSDSKPAALYEPTPPFELEPSDRVSHALTPANYVRIMSWVQGDSAAMVQVHKAADRGGVSVSLPPVAEFSVDGGALLLNGRLVLPFY